LIIREKSYPRAALLGNPSDGYYGKTIAFPFSNFCAEVVLYETPELEILPAEYDSNVFNSIHELADDVQLFGYYGGIRLLKAAVKKFYTYCVENSLALSNKNFTIRYRSDIPYKLGLAGSSAIITACMKALKCFYNVEIDRPIMANLVLSVEVDELQIAAGLQDRVVQAFESPVFMDFNKDIMDKQNYGDYHILDRALFRNLYIAYRTDLSQGSEVMHNDFRERFHFNDKEVLDAIRKWAELTEKGREALIHSDLDRLSQYIDTNFDIRRSVMNISQKNIQMVELARSVGASAKFTGSGGAIIGSYKDEEMYSALVRTLNEKKIEVIKPQVL